MLHDVGNNRDCDVDVDHRNNTTTDCLCSFYGKFTEDFGSKSSTEQKVYGTFTLWTFHFLCGLLDLIRDKNLS